MSGWLGEATTCILDEICTTPGIFRYMRPKAGQQVDHGVQNQ
jgi:hypothetical protein